VARKRHEITQEFNDAVRALVVSTLRQTGCAPSVHDLAAVMKADQDDVTAALRALEARRSLVLDSASGRVRMAHPFSGVPTDFVVTIDGRRWFANCAWDGLSILALLGDGSLDTHSPASGEPIRFEVEGGTVRGDGVIHFLVPARHFWDDIVFT
jgi:hypothetical protein